MTFYQNGIPNNFTGSQQINQIGGFPTGNRYISLFNNEQIQVKIPQLEPGRTYYAELYVKHTNCVAPNIGRLELWASNYDVPEFDYNGCCFLTVLEDFGLNQSAEPWDKVTTCFQADVFCNGSQPLNGLSIALLDYPTTPNSRVYLDDFKLVPLLDLGDDIVVCNTSLPIILQPTCPIDGLTYNWSIPSGVNVNFPCGNPDCSSIEITSWPSNVSSISVSCDVSIQNSDNECSALDEITIIFDEDPEFSIDGSNNMCESTEYCYSVSQTASGTFSFEVSEGATITSNQNGCIEVDWGELIEGQISVTYTTTLGCSYTETITTYLCCQGTYKTFVNPQITDFLNNSSTNSPSVKTELAQWLSISPLNGSSYTSSPAGISVTMDNSILGTVSIVGNLIVDVGQLTITDSELLFSECGGVLFNGDFPQDLVIQNDSYLHSCDGKLWNGIIVNGAVGSSINMSHSKIEDAYTGIYLVNQPDFTIQNNVFNQNITHIRIRNSNYLNSAVITGNDFLCNASSNPVFGGTLSLMSNETDCEDAGFVPFITNFGIDLQLVNNVTIESNDFENAYCGIRSLSSSIVAFKNDFSKIRNYVNPIWYDASSTLAPYSAMNNEFAGCGIYGENSYLSTPSFNAGGYIDVSGSTFKDVQFGIKINNKNLSYLGISSTTKTNILIQYNEFDNIAYPFDFYSGSNTAVGIFGVSSAGLSLSNTTFAQNVVVDNNSIQGFANGIVMKNCTADIDVTNNLFNTVVQNNNWKFGNAISFAAIGSIQWTFITLNYWPFNQIQIPIAVAFEPYNIQSNTIGQQVPITDLNARGIGVKVMSSNYGNIEGNSIFMSPIISSQQGISSIKSNDVNIINNNVYRPSQAISPSWLQSQNNGILIQDSKNNIVCENEISYFASGLTVQNLSNNMKIKCNEFFESQYQGVSLRNAIFGDQNTSTGDPFDNRWIDASLNSMRIKGQLSLNGGPHKWYYGSVGGYTSEYFLDQNAQSLANVNVAPFNSNPPPFQPWPYLTSSIPECGTLSNCTLHGRSSFFESKRVGERDSLFGNIVSLVNPELLTDTSAAEYFSLAEYVFETFYTDSTWLNLSDPSDTLYQNFFEACLDLPSIKQFVLQFSSNGLSPDSLMLDSLSTLYNDNDSLIAAAINQWTSSQINNLIAENDRITPLHQRDVESKQALNVYYNSWLKGRYTLSNADSIALNAIAFQDPSVAGEGVYLARMLLDTIVIEPESQARLSQILTEEENSNSILPIVYPNPNDGTFVVDLNFDPESKVLLTLTDITGRTIFKGVQETRTQSYSFKSLSAGVYIYKIELKNELLMQGKLIIQSQ